MKLFRNFYAVKFPEENLIFITCDDYLYYIYNPKYHIWRKHHGAGNDHLTVSNYPDVSKFELVTAMNGLFPRKETDFMRLCRPSQLCVKDLLDLLAEDHPKYMADHALFHAVHRFLSESDIRSKSFEKIQALLRDATAKGYSSNQVLGQVKDLSFSMIGRDIFKKEIGIVDGRDSSSYFLISAVRVIDYENTADWDSVAAMDGVGISIEEDDVADYLTPFLFQHFDEELEANKKRRDVSGFEWYLEHNFFPFDSMELILKDIEDTMDALIAGRETEYTKKLGIQRGSADNAGSPAEGGSEVALVVDFYRRFVYRMEYMMKVGKEKGYNLITFVGP